MSQLVLDRNARLLLQAKAHHLDPVVLLGGNGLTEAVIKEVDRALTAHGLIKVKVPSDDACGSCVVQIDHTCRHIRRESVPH